MKAEYVSVMFRPGRRKAEIRERSLEDSLRKSNNGLRLRMKRRVEPRLIGFIKSQSLVGRMDCRAFAGQGLIGCNVSAARARIVCGIRCSMEWRRSGGGVEEEWRRNGGGSILRRK
jgi:hypothetical protein